MQFDPKHDYRSALERMEQSRALYRRDDDLNRVVNMHPLAIYVTGVAVECMLRAYILRKSLRSGGQRKIDGRHNIWQLYEESGMWRVSANVARVRSLTDEQLNEIKRELDAAVNRVDRLWKNHYRYASEERLRSSFFEIGEHRGIKGDLLKENLRRLIESASKIVSRGTLLWDAP